MDLAYYEEMLQELKPFTKHPHHRNDEDIEGILAATANVQFFKRLTEEKKSDFIHREACKHLRLQVFSRGETVLSFGEVGEEFFIILKGVVGVLIPHKPSKTQHRLTENEFRRMLSRKPKDFENFLDPDIQKREALVKAKFEEHLLSRANTLRRANSKLNMKFVKAVGEIEEMKEVGTLKAGQNFGELALVSNSPRAATITCKEFCIFATLDKHNFERILSKETQKALESKALFLQTLPLFSSIPKSTLVKLSYFFTETKFSKNQNVYKAYDDADKVYFVKSGEFKLAKWKDFGSKPLISQGNNTLLKLANVREVKNGIDLQFSLKGSNEMFGQEEILENKKIRECSCKCQSTEGILYSIPKNVLIT